MAVIGFPKRGDIYWANLDPTIGSEISKTRPVLIVSNDINNQFSSTISILPITSNVGKIYPFEVLIKAKESGLKTDSKIKANQIRTLDKVRIGKKIGELPLNKINDVNISIMIHLGIEKI
ncbi:type II toxin-antitoxin system PemK/MazF family toxin [Aquiflexum lacus]|uniref:type II toxin-antitoxin system PemK/MazF family toxin n=1 Tax=Aquiflexum lacus TaxID=2483805 RepID=UPI0018949C0F|nr:type II toxin-antitoxin system PemK/MazF family toxin [Aquiflexum lacus]